MWLHEVGYTYLTMYQLTLTELERLQRGWKKRYGQTTGDADGSSMSQKVGGGWREADMKALDKVNRRAKELGLV